MKATVYCLDVLNQVLALVQERTYELDKMQLATCIKQLYKHFYQCLQHDQNICEAYVTNLRYNPWFKVCLSSDVICLG